MKILKICVDPMDRDYHEAGALLNISTGQIAQPAGNVDCPVTTDWEQLKQFETTWPDGIYGRLSKHVVIFATQKKHVLVGEQNVLD